MATFSKQTLRSTWRYRCFEAFFDWLICKILSSDWSIEAFVAPSEPQPKYMGEFVYAVTAAEGIILSLFTSNEQ